MPASSGVGIVSSHIEGTLRASLGQCRSSGQSIDQKLVSSSKRVLLHNIEFAPAESDSAYQLEVLRSKYTPLNSLQAKETPSGPSPLNQKSKNEVVLNGYTTNVKTMTGSADAGDGIPRPALVLYPAEKVQLEWKHPRHIGVGLRNNNNNCYVNSILQCLTYTAPLVNYLYSNEHTYKCKQVGFCMLCELQRHVKRCLEQPRLPNKDSAICPQSILGKIKMIAKHLTYGRQEDAHEFLRYVVEAMQKACLNGYSEKLDRMSKDTTVVNQIFGGYLRSQVLCLRCRERSNTYDPLLDISLDIKNVNNITKAFERFVQPETLENDNAYNCTRCKTKVHAQKRFTVHRPPNVLTVQIKRFDYNRLQGGKVNKHVGYPEKLDLRPYMSQKQGPPVMYQLYAVLVHVGGSCFSGHYYCYVRAPNRMWYIMNDSHVSQVSVGRVLNAEAYLLFYCRMKSPNINNNVQKPLIGPKLPMNHNNNLYNTQKSNSSLGEPTNDVGTPVSRKPSSSVSDSALQPRSVGQKTDNQPGSFAKVPPANPPPPKPTTIPLPSQRDKVSFGISKLGSKDDTAVLEANKPRIVMHIKNGKVFFPADGEKDPAVPKVNGDDAKSLKSKLVPYTNDSSASEEEETLVIQPKPSVSGCPSVKEKPTLTTKVDGPIFDKRLNATTIVPGAYKPLDSGTEPSCSGMIKPKDRGDASPTKPSQLRFSSPVKKGMGDALSVVTSPSTPHRINATTPWHVLDAEAAISPSLASGSSNTSMNSTTEWHITPGVENRKLSFLPEAQRNGWKVTPVPEHRSGETPNQNEKDDVQDQQPSHPHKELNITIKKQPHNGGWESKPKHSDLLKNNEQEVMTDKDGPSVPTVLDELSDVKAAEDKSKSSESSTSQLLNGLGGSTDTDSSSPHRKHKKKKHKKRHSSEQDEDQVNGCGALELLQKLKKKKKKKHKHKPEDEEHLLSTSDSDISRRGSKRSSSSSEECDTDKKKSRKDRDDCKNSSAFVWVEKTKETIEKEKTAKKEAPVRTWDQHVTDGYRRRTEECQKSRWDGARSSCSSSIVSDLKKFSSRGYGAQVSSWDGGKNHVDQDVDRERHYEYKRHRMDDYEEELDRGKTKKIKKSYSDCNYGGYNSYNSGNPFQKAHDMRNVDKDRRPPGKYERCDRPSYGYSHHSYNHRGNHHGYSSHYNSHRPRDGGYRGNSINKHSSSWYH